MAEESNADRLAELKAERQRLQAQAYMLKVSLEFTEQQIARVGSVIAEVEALEREAGEGGKPEDNGGGQ